MDESGKGWVVMGSAFTLGMVCVVVFVVIFAAKSQAHFKQAESLQDEEKSLNDAE